MCQASNLPITSTKFEIDSKHALLEDFGTEKMVLKRNHKDYDVMNKGIHRASWHS